MNTYNDNLHSNVVASLNSQELDLKNAKAKLDSSVFSLYYAEGKRITAQENLDKTEKRYKTYKKMYDTAVIDHNISVNVSSAADDFKQHNALAVSNMAVAASNVEIAKNAIVRLASTMSGIYSILHAADYGSDLCDQAKTANRYMTDTAYEAENASNIALQASALMAEVSAPTVAADAKSTNDSVAGLLTALTGNFNSTAEELAARNTELAAASDEEKETEGEVVYVNADYYAAQSAYKLSNRELNLNLRVSKLEEDSYTVSFKAYESPFIKKNVANYYNIMLVKNRSKSTFSLDDAEALDSSPGQIIRMKPDEAVDGIFTKKIYNNMLKDADGKFFELGTDYVIFVLVVFNDTEYKKVINNFNNYLTAPSDSFKLTIHLVAPAANSIVVNAVTSPVGSTDGNRIKIEENIQVLNFSFEAEAEYEVEYRCMFLPDQSDLIADLLTATGLRRIEDETEMLENIADIFVPQINEIQAEINTKYSDKDSLENKLAELQKRSDWLIIEIEKLSKFNLPVNTEEIKKLRAELEHIPVEIGTLAIEVGGLEADLGNLNKKLKKLEKEEKKEIKKLLRRKNLRPGFFFNRKLAEQVSPANYIVPLLSQMIAPASEGGSESRKGKNKQQEDVSPNKMWQVSIPILDNATDNFGTPLIKGNVYIPVILAFSTETEENLVQFSNALSDFVNTASFEYLALHKINYIINNKS